MSHLHPAYEKWIESSDCSDATKALHASMRSAGYDLIRADRLDRSGSDASEFLSHWFDGENAVFLWEGHGNAMSTPLTSVSPSEITGDAIWTNQYGDGR